MTDDHSASRRVDVLAEQAPHLIAPEPDGDTSLIWTCSCGTQRVNYPYGSCRKCGQRAPSRVVLDAGGEVY